jgi:hypothetical protein
LLVLAGRHQFEWVALEPIAIDGADVSVQDSLTHRCNLADLH